MLNIFGSIAVESSVLSTNHYRNIHINDSYSYSLKLHSEIVMLSGCKMQIADTMNTLVEKKLFVDLTNKST